MFYLVRKTQMFGPLLCFIFLLFGLFAPAQASLAATNDGWDENFELTGSFTGRFQLDSNASQLFRVENALPGDCWNGDITIHNKAGQAMEVALLTIASEIEDLDLYNALTLDIEIGGELVYSGIYGETPNQITPYYVIPAGGSIVLSASVGFPYYHGNQLHNKIMDSIWTFDAIYHEENAGASMYEYTVYYLNKETKESLLSKKVAYAALNSTVTEYAPDIVGYIPDARKKSISIHDSGNKIFFFYETDSKTVGVSGRSDSKTTNQITKVPIGAKTGHNMSQSNTMPLVNGIISVLCTCAILITCLRVYAAKRRYKGK